MKKQTYTFWVLLLALGLMLVACGGATEEPADTSSDTADTAETTTEDSEEMADEEMAEEETADEEMAEEEMADEEMAEETADEEMAESDRVVVRWFVGLGTGQNAEQVAAQEAVVEAFNASQEEIELKIEIVQNDVAYDTLATAIASGDAPDIIGPVGVKGSNAFTGSWMDLEPVAESSGYDLGQFPEAAVDFYRVEGEGLIGLPFGVFPSFIYYNRALFDEAGLDYPPHQYGEPYADGDPWDYDKVRELAMFLTVDANGNEAGSPDFDPEAIEQFGFINQWTDLRGSLTQFGAGNLVDGSGNAVMPDQWMEGLQWQYNGIWVDHFMPSQAYQDSELLATPNAFASGNVAMAQTHLWFTCCLGEMEDEWDMAVMPTYNGEPTAKLHADTFRILNTTEHPDEAFTVLTYLIGEASGDLLQVYGGMPARTEETDAFFAGLEEQYPFGVDWQVALDSLNYPDNPSHEGNMPNFQKADDRTASFYSLLQTDGTIDLAAEVETFLGDMQSIFDEVQ
ncbi:MAG: extracellular solute-binding protein [Ardenticatenaceae bacterium]|nr:extracellular solute-binding protein [Ardenticatenaceae bacterium]